MAPPKTYLALCEKAEKNPHSSEEDRNDFAQLATSHFDTTTTNTTTTSKKKDQLLVEIIMDLGLASGMNGGLIVFMEKRNKLGGTL